MEVVGPYFLRTMSETTDQAPQLTRKTRKCTESGCTEAPFCRELCRRHYLAHRNTGKFTELPPKEPVKPVKIYLQPSLLARLRVHAPGVRDLSPLIREVLEAWLKGQITPG